MTVYPEVHVVQIRDGVAAEATQFGLAGHGEDEAAAVAALRRGLLAWCRSLSRQGLLEKGLDRHGVEWEKVGADIEIRERVSAGELTSRYENPTAPQPLASQSPTAPQA